MESDSDDSRKSSSSSDQDDTAMDIKSADIKLQQMRRVARKKRGQANKLEGLQSYETIMRTHGLRRMQEGLSRVLGLHTPVELSSICGSLKLKPQQKANHSIEQIMRYASAQEEMVEERIRLILGFMWEGALWEYLHSIGHPVFNMRIDPRDTIYEIWKEGGLLEGGHGVFVPHFIVREVKKRNEWVQSEDIQQRLASIQEAQDKAKIAERRVISEHDYTNILAYFNQMSSLRRLENSIREYLASELEIARSRIDSLTDTTKMLRAQLGENEIQFMKVAELLNTRLATAEYLRDKAVKERLNMESTIHRMNGIIESYSESQRNREEFHGGTQQALKPRHADKLPTVLQETFRRLQDYRDQRDRADDDLRARARCHVFEINHLNRTVEEMEKQYEALRAEHSSAQQRYDALMLRFILADRKNSRLEDLQKHQTNTSWRTAAKISGDALAYRVRINKVRGVLQAGLVHSHPAVVDLCWTLSNALQVNRSNEERLEWQETMEMKREEYLSRQAEVAEKARQSLLVTSPKASKKGKAAAAGKKSPVKSGKSAKASKADDASATGRSVATANSSNASKKGGSKSPSKAGTSSKGGSNKSSARGSPSPSKPSTPALQSPGGRKINTPNKGAKRK